MRRLLLAAIIIAPLTMLGLVDVLAQTPAPAPRPITGTELYTPVRDYVIMAVTALFGVLGLWVVALFQKWTGIQVEADHREALQTALRNAAGLVVSQIDRAAAGVSIPVGDQKVREAVDYVLKSAPEAAKHFNLTPTEVAEKIRAHIPQIVPATEISPVVVTPPQSPSTGQRPLTR